MKIDNTHNPVLGIDLGTTFSAIARWDGRGPRTYEILGKKTLQSAVYYAPKTDEFLVGELAYRRGLVFPENMSIGIKRLMDDAEKKVKVGDKEFTPIELSARILGHLYKAVEEKYPPGMFRGRGTVVTVPYYFKAHQCENTRKAAEHANIECVGIIQEPIAASLSYAWQLVQETPDREEEEMILVFDLGGGTFDLTLFRLGQTKEKLIFEVLATGGDDRLGGMDFDQCLAKLLLEKGGISLDGLKLQDERKARQKLLEQAIIAKITLSATEHTYVTVADIIPGQHLDTEVTRQEFEGAIQHYTTKIEEIITNLFVTAGIRSDQVDRVIRVGGSSNLSRMKTLLNDLVGEDKIYGDIDAALCVAEGAAMYAAYFDDREVFGREIDIRRPTSHALGIETAGGAFYELISANRKTPCKACQSFTIDEDNVTSLDIKVYQGRAKLVKDNSHIGNVNINGLPKRSKDDLDIDVTFGMNEELMLSVTVQVKDTVEGKIIMTKTGAFKSN